MKKLQPENRGLGIATRRFLGMVLLLSTAMTGCQGAGELKNDAAASPTPTPSNSPTTSDESAAGRILSARIAVPDMPNFPDARAISPRAVAISWRHGGAGVHGYTIYRATFPDMDYAPVFSGMLADTTFVDPTVVSGKRYFYFVAAYNQFVESKRSRVTHVVVPSQLASAQPRIHGPDKADGPYRLRWAFEGDAERFELESSLDGFATVEQRIDIPAIDGLDTFERLIVPRANDTQVVTHWRIRAIDRAGKASPNSHPSVVAVQPLPANRSLARIEDVPSFSDNGAFNMSCTFGGTGAPREWVLEEANSVAFTDAKQFSYEGGTNTLTLTFEDVPDGTYFYRVGASPEGPFSDPRWVTVRRPEPSEAIFRVVNNSPLDVVSITINGTEVLYSKREVLYPDAFAEWDITESGPVEYKIQAGTTDGLGSVDVWFVKYGKIEVSPAMNTTVSLELDVIDLLSRDQSDGQMWVAQRGSKGRAQLSYAFLPDGSWTEFRNGVPLATGEVLPMKWDNHSPMISFRLCDDCPTLVGALPFDSFQQPVSSSGDTIMFRPE